VRPRANAERRPARLETEPGALAQALAPALAYALALSSCAGESASREAAMAGGTPPPVFAASEATPSAIPHPDLESFEPAVATQIAALRDDVARATAPGSSSDVATRARAYGELGRAYHAYELFDAAAACYGRAVELAPGDPGWIYLAAVAAQRRGRLDQSADLLRRVLDANPRSLPALLRLGDVELDAGRAAPARAAFERALEQHASEAAALYGLGRAAQSQHDWEEARDFFSRALAAQPDASIVHYALGQTLRELGAETEARRQLSLAGPDPVRFHDDAVRAVEALATGSGAHLLAGGRALAIGDYETSIAEHRLAVSADPTSVEASLGLAFSYLRAGGHPEEAKTALRSALRLAPDRAYVHYTVGANLAALGELEEAERALRRALELDGHYLEAHFSLGRVLAVRGRHQDAVRELTTVLELDPRVVDALFARGDSLARLGRDAEALADLEAALALDPSRLEAQLWVADALARERSWDRAIAHYDAVLALDPARREAWMKKATALFIAARYQEAADTLERGLEQLPDDRLLATATARFLASCPERTLRDGRRALVLAERLFAHEENLENAELVAMAHAEIGDWNEAVAWQQRALDAAKRSGDQRLSAMLARNLERYRGGQSCCAGD
jgi:tetratricopeptide (TPR) repeat protein